ncbi:MAG: zinc-binding alcohol dehydrogenase [Spirochaetes bacterium]|nr:MAG: zinc-binding alcohol dehydrogenase [Spirochaetota bacterium]RLA88125.1 MAG: zinc-binding alcohol dehydrogenase [Deltaproteobacteria bacterium]
MKRKTRSMVLEGPRKMRMWEFDIPKIKDDDALLKVEMTGVCGSDPGIYNGKAFKAPRPYPIIMGHEIIGYIEEIGERFAEKNKLKKGDRVILEYAFGCGECYSCITGNYITCEKNLNYGSMISCKNPPHLFGGYGEYVYLHPRAMVHKVSNNISPETGVLISAVLGNAIRWLRHKGNISIGETVVIIGPGQQGLAAAIVAKESGASNIIIAGRSKDKKRLALAKQFGANYIIDVDKEDLIASVKDITNGDMADIAMDVSGSPAGAKIIFDLVKQHGRVVMPGLYGSTKEIPVVLDKMIIKELTVLGVFSQDIKSVLPAIKLAESNKYPLDNMVTHRFKVEEAEKAVQIAGGEFAEEEPIKVVLIP